MKTENWPDESKTFIDALSLVTVVATLVDMLPSIAAMFTIAWTAIRIWETDTVRKLVGRKRRRSRATKEDV